MPNLVMTIAMALASALTLPAYNVVPEFETRESYVSTFAGTGHHGHQDGHAARFNMPMALTRLPGVGLVVFDTHNNLLRLIDEDGYVSTLSGSILDYTEFGFPAGYYIDGFVEDALFDRPTHGVYHDGFLYIADSVNDAIRVMTFSEDGTPYYMYTIAGGLGRGFLDGAILQAQLSHPKAVALGVCGMVFFADTLNHVIRRLDAEGNVSTVAGVPGVFGFHDGDAHEAMFFSPMGIVIDESGVIYVADTGNHLIRIIEDGVVRTLAGTHMLPDYSDEVNPPDEPIGFFADGFLAGFNLPTGLALWRDVLIVADSANHRIRGITPEGESFTIAGEGIAGYRNAPAMQAHFLMPRGIFVDCDVLYIADTGNNVIRVLHLTSHAD